MNKKLHVLPIRQRRQILFTSEHTVFKNISDTASVKYVVSSITANNLA